MQPASDPVGRAGLVRNLERSRRCCLIAEVGEGGREGSRGPVQSCLVFTWRLLWSCASRAFHTPHSGGLRWRLSELAPSEMQKHLHWVQHLQFWCWKFLTSVLRSRLPSEGSCPLLTLPRRFAAWLPSVLWPGTSLERGVISSVIYQLHLCFQGSLKHLTF